MDSTAISKRANDRSKNGATAWLIKPDGTQIQLDYEGKITATQRPGPSFPS